MKVLETLTESEQAESLFEEIMAELSKCKWSSSLHTQEMYIGYDWSNLYHANVYDKGRILKAARKSEPSNTTFQR